MKNILLAILAFIIYAAGCLFIIHSYLPPQSNANKTYTVDDATAAKIKQQEALRLKDSLARIKESQLALENESLDVNDTIAMPIYNEAQYIAKFTASRADLLFTPILFAVTDVKGQTLSNCADYATIFLNSPKVRIPTQCMEYGLKIKTLLSERPSSKLLIIGLHSTSESAAQGKKRADYIKNLLQGAGADPERLIAASRAENLTYNLGTLQGGLQLILLDQTAMNDTPSQSSIPAQTSTKSTPYGYKRFTKGFQSDVYYGDQIATSYIANLQEHLKSDGNLRVTVESYVSTNGVDTDKVALAKKNANTVKQLLLESGVPGYKIKLAPIEASNAVATKPSVVLIVK